VELPGSRMAGLACFESGGPTSAPCARSDGLHRSALTRRWCVWFESRHVTSRKSCGWGNPENNWTARPFPRTAWARWRDRETVRPKLVLLALRRNRSRSNPSVGRAARASATMAAVGFARAREIPLCDYTTSLFSLGPTRANDQSQSNVLPNRGGPRIGGQTALLRQLL
jgi:hypothetical protein